MDSTTLDALFANAAQGHDDRRVSHEPRDGYVLNPWSGLYQETEATYRSRLDTTAALNPMLVIPA